MRDYLVKNLKYLLIDANVKHYEDGIINGTRDVSMSQIQGHNMIPKVPCVERISNANDFRWRPIIEISTGLIKNWRESVTAKIHYYACVDCVYVLLNQFFEEICEVESYVPKFLSIGNEGFGDYIIMDVDEKGYIQNWNCTLDDIYRLLRSDVGCRYEGLI